MKTKILTAILVASLLTACDKSESGVTENGSAVSFSTGIATRAVGTTWESDDEIGAYMYLNNQTEIYTDSDNAKYYVAEGSDLAAATFSSDVPLCYPRDASPVDFVAYYPYNTSMQNGKLVINTSSQTSQEEMSAIDYMVARASYIVEGGDIPELIFSRIMSKLTFKIQYNETHVGSTLSDFVFGGAVTDATLQLANSDTNTTTLSLGSTSSNIPLYFENDQTEVVLAPQTLSSSSLDFNIDGYPYFVTLSKELEAGKQYTYTLEVGLNEVKLGSAVIIDWTEDSYGLLDPTLDM